jgi:catechol 2,3-dioxygenase-like lactoylglutathione lyase family enzyme
MYAEARYQEPVGMHLHRIDHVSLDVRDRRRSLEWYEAVLGLGPVRTHDRPDQPVFLGPAGARLGLFEERQPGLRHVALAVDAAEQHRVLERLERLAIPHRRERRSLYFTDPDGATLELLV